MNNMNIIAWEHKSTLEGSLQISACEYNDPRFLFS